MTTNVGRAVPRKEGPGKVTGAARYIDDMSFPNALHGAVIRSPVARGRIKEIVYEDGIPWDEFTIVTAADIPGRNIQALIVEDQPCLADGVVNHREEPVVLIAHPDKTMIERARGKVRIEIEPLPSVATIEESLACDPVVWGEDNVQKEYLVEKGSLEGVFEREDVVVVEGEYHTGAQEQLYIEPQGMVARADPEDGVTIWGSLQCPYYVQKGIGAVFDLPPEKIRIVHATTGGGFGGKEEYPSVIAAHAALLAHKSGKTVKVIFDRAEDMQATTKRHPSRTLHRTAVTKDGTIVAMDVDFVIDGGAYATLSAVVLSRGTIHAAGPYAVENVRIRARSVATNLPPHGAFRGFGAPQSCFALERHLDKVAAAIGISPEELRRKNILKEGDTTATGQLVSERVDMPGLMDKAFEMSAYHEKRARFAKENAAGGRFRRGIGFATFYHGAGFTGSGETYLKSRVGIEATPEGQVRILAASTEIGQGTNTVFSQIAADALGIDYEFVEVARPDTSQVPDSGPTVASRTTMVVGKLVADAALKLRTTLQDAGLLEPGGDTSAFRRACRDYIAKEGALRVEVQYEQPPGIQWDEERYRGDAYGTYAWACYVAEVEVDTVTWSTEVKDFVAVQEVGRVIHPVLAAGQIEGGVAQGVGYAIYEKVEWRDGTMANNRMTNYIIPTSADIPEIRVHFEEQPYAYGGGGAKGIGELPLDGSAPAVINAICEAVGRDVDTIPLLPEDLFEIMEEQS